MGPPDRVSNVDSSRVPCTTISDRPETQPVEGFLSFLLSVEGQRKEQVRSERSIETNRTCRELLGNLETVRDQSRLHTPGYIRSDQPLARP